MVLFVSVVTEGKFLLVQVSWTSVEGCIYSWDVPIKHLCTLQLWCIVSYCSDKIPFG